LNNKTNTRGKLDFSAGCRQVKKQLLTIARASISGRMRQFSCWTTIPRWLNGEKRSSIA